MTFILRIYSYLNGKVVDTNSVLAPQIAGHNLKNKLGLIKFGNHDINTTKTYT